MRITSKAHTNVRCGVNSLIRMPVLSDFGSMIVSHLTRSRKCFKTSSENEREFLVPCSEPLLRKISSTLGANEAIALRRYRGMYRGSSCSLHRVSVGVLYSNLYSNIPQGHPTAGTSWQQTLQERQLTSLLLKPQSLMHDSTSPISAGHGFNV